MKERGLAGATSGPAAVDGCRLLPHRPPRQPGRALFGRTRPPSQDRHRVGHPGTRSHGTGRVRRPGRRRRHDGPRLGLPARSAGPSGGRGAESFDSESLSTELGHRCVTVVAKAPNWPRYRRPGWPGPWILPPGSEALGPLLLTRAHNRMNRQAATAVSTRRLPKAAGVTKHISGTRCATVSPRLFADVALRDVQVAARHADPRSATHYDRAPSNLDRNPATSLPPSSPAPARPPSGSVAGPSWAPPKRTPPIRIGTCSTGVRLTPLDRATRSSSRSGTI